MFLNWSFVIFALWLDDASHENVKRFPNRISVLRFKAIQYLLASEMLSKNFFFGPTGERDSQGSTRLHDATRGERTEFNFEMTTHFPWTEP